MPWFQINDFDIIKLIRPSISLSPSLHLQSTELFSDFILSESSDLFSDLAIKRTKFQHCLRVSIKKI